jgi:Holliday junction resolvasome RuvABC endonuclease subunit
VKILQLDQSITCTGWAVVAYDDTLPHPYGALYAAGRIKPGPSKMWFLDRLLVLKKDIQSLIDLYRPDVIVCEAVSKFQQRGPKVYRALVAVSELIEQLAEENNCLFRETHPATIKKYAANHGKADKHEMINAARMMWRVNIDKADTCDALCGAAHSLKVMGKDIMEVI